MSILENLKKKVIIFKEKKKCHLKSYNLVIFPIDIFVYFSNVFLNYLHEILHIIQNSCSFHVATQLPKWKDLILSMIMCIFLKNFI